MASTRAGTSAQVTVTSAAGSRVWSSSSTAGPAGSSSQRRGASLTPRVSAMRTPPGHSPLEAIDGPSLHLEAIDGPSLHLEESDGTSIALDRGLGCIA